MTQAFAERYEGRVGVVEPNLLVLAEILSDK